MDTHQKKRGFLGFFNRFSQKVTQATGSPYAFFTALLAVVIWAVLGPVFGFSDTWQLVINTGTTIITFLMVFVIQQSQNKDTVALQLKLNELLAAKKSASNRLIAIEELTEEELEEIKSFYKKLSELAQKDEESLDTHTQQEAQRNHELKKERKTEKNEE